MWEMKAGLFGWVICLEGFKEREVMLGWFGWRDDGGDQLLR